MSPDARAALIRAFFADVLMVVALHQSRAEECESITSLEAGARRDGVQLDLIVYDNTPGKSVTSVMLDPGLWRVTYVHDPENRGVSLAYVTGAQLARERAKRWIFLLDQDTIFPNTALEAYARAASDFPRAPLLCPTLVSNGHVLSPCAYRRMRGRELPSVVPGVHSFQNVSVLNSGMCVRLDAYDTAGGHDVRIPLDFSDHEFIERFGKSFTEFVVVDAIVEQQLSALQKQSPERALRRFRAYAKGAINSRRGVTMTIGGVCMVIARSVLLAYRHRRLRFISAGISETVGAVRSRDRTS